MPRISTTQVGVLLLQCSAFVLSVVCQERVLRRAPLLSTVGWTSLLSSILFAHVAAASGKAHHLVDADEYSAAALGTLFFAATAPTLGTSILIAHGTRHLPVSLVATTSAAFVPVWTSLFNWLLLGSAIAPLAAVGDLFATVAIGCLARVQVPAGIAGSNEPENAILTPAICRW